MSRNSQCVTTLKPRQVGSGEFCHRMWFPMWLAFKFNQSPKDSCHEAWLKQFHSGVISANKSSDLSVIGLISLDHFFFHPMIHPVTCSFCFSTTKDTQILLRQICFQNECWLEVPLKMNNHHLKWMLPTQNEWSPLKMTDHQKQWHYIPGFQGGR